MTENRIQMKLVGVAMLAVGLAVLLAIGVGVRAVRLRESSELREFKAFVEASVVDVGAKHEAVQEKNAEDWEEVIKRWSELSPADKQLIAREKQAAAKSELDAQMQAFFAANSEEARDRILDEDLAEWERKKSIQEKTWAQEKLAKKSVQTAEKKRHDPALKDQWERSKLDLSTAEERARVQAYYEALKARYHELND